MLSRTSLRILRMSDMSADVFFKTPCFQVPFFLGGLRKSEGVFTWRFHSSFCFFGAQDS